MMNRQFGIGAVVYALASTILQLAGPARAAPIVQDGPFGIAMGEPLSRLGPVKLIGSNTYQVLHPPKTNDKFRVVKVEAYPSAGICFIEGDTDAVDGDQHGDMVRSLIDGVSQSLTSKYGPYTEKKNACDGDDETCETIWAIKLSAGQVSYAYIWRFDDKPRADQVDTIVLSAASVEMNSNLAMIGYFDHSPSCKAAENSTTGSSL